MCDPSLRIWISLLFFAANQETFRPLGTPLVLPFAASLAFLLVNVPTLEASPLARVYWLEERRPERLDQAVLRLTVTRRQLRFSYRISHCGSNVAFLVSW